MFSVVRESNGAVLFDSSAAPLSLEDQSLTLWTYISRNPNLDGLEEQPDSFDLNNTGYTRTS